MRQMSLTLARAAGSFYRPVCDAFTVSALLAAMSTGRDLLLEMVALRHQLAVLGRRNRRFRTSDRLFWVCLRRWWPRWKDRLVLVHPATVARWRREGFRWLRHRARRRPGRPRIEPQLRSLIQRMAMENGLWGRPANPRRVAEARIHCFRTHGVAVSARPTDETVANLADILREPRRQPGVHLDDDVVVRDEP